VPVTSGILMLCGRTCFCGKVVFVTRGVNI